MIECCTGFDWFYFGTNSVAANCIIFLKFPNQLKATVYETGLVSSTALICINVILYSIKCLAQKPSFVFYTSTNVKARYFKLFDSTATTQSTSE